MNKKDKLLLQVYMEGFSDELDNIDNYTAITIAYKLGRLDAQVGDDVRSVDYQTDEEIIKRIKDKL
jgi:hypothetical protein